MEKFEKLKSTITPLNIENIDTDQIIPARFLKAVLEMALEKIYLEIGDTVQMGI